MFGVLVRSYRRQQGMTQEDLARKSGMSIRGIRKIECGQVVTARTSTARLLADAFHLAGPEREWFCAMATRTAKVALVIHPSRCRCPGSSSPVAPMVFCSQPGTP